MSAPDRSGTADDPLSVGLGNRSTGPADGGAAEPAPQQAPQKERHPGRAIGRSLALALLIFVTVLLVLFVVFNGQTVQISLVFGDVEAPLVVALLIAAALGGLLVWLASIVLRARRRRR
ncbi:LapA family protein [Blastococcus sp. VKM Ac-2987]|uniref:LapA family protein n=1 Tax=Blastococcus sp. VKM Ac-2987 TaxID=3004141 RepID=UPI0022AB7351|nr:LapA family protein [Blastococcus sp. VKM Ac-2987]MCZ2859076.1 LapA family protein [Blastococcus sp. VKM Ac-2987]